MNKAAPERVTPWRILRAYLLVREYATTKSLFDALRKHNERYTQKAFHNLLTRSKQKGLIRQPKRLTYALTQKGRGDVAGPEGIELGTPHEPTGKPICPVVPEAAQKLWGQRAPEMMTKIADSLTNPGPRTRLGSDEGIDRLAKETPGQYMLRLEGTLMESMKIYTTEQEAQEQAERLARLERRPVLILKAIANIKLAESPVIREELP